jgi:DNA gyrase/topoisomerase IV subunit A
VVPGTEIFVTSSDGIVIRQAVEEISRQKRASTGVKVMNLQDGAELTAFALVPPDED